MLYSLAGGVVSLIVMVLARRMKGLSVVGVSVAGALAHNVGQMSVAVFVVGTRAILAYLPVLLLSRVLTQLGVLPGITPEIIADLFVIDFAYLEYLYQRLNSPEPVVIGAVGPYFSGQFHLQVTPLA